MSVEFENRKNQFVASLTKAATKSSELNAKTVEPVFNQHSLVGRYLKEQQLKQIADEERGKNAGTLSQLNAELGRVQAEIAKVQDETRQAALLAYQSNSIAVDQQFAELKKLAQSEIDSLNGQARKLQAQVFEISKRFAYPEPCINQAANTDLLCEFANDLLRIKAADLKSGFSASDLKEFYLLKLAGMSRSIFETGMDRFYEQAGRALFEVIFPNKLDEHRNEGRKMVEERFLAEVAKI